MTTTDNVQVTQADREAAASFAEWLTAAQSEWVNMTVWFTNDFPTATRKGIWDNHELTQTFARHRHQALIEGAKLGLDAAAKACYEQQKEAKELGQWQAVFWSSQLRQAIRNLNPEAIIKDTADD
jgi:hypothetical protein